jgi:hypothetical protein
LGVERDGVEGLVALLALGRGALVVGREDLRGRLVAAHEQRIAGERRARERVGVVADLGILSAKARGRRHASVRSPTCPSRAPTGGLRLTRLSLGCADLHGGKAVGEGSEDAAAGVGFKGGLGYTLPVPLIELTPEVQVGWTRFGAANLPPGVDGSTALLTAMGGARVAVGSVLKPFAYLHLGYSRYSGSLSGGGQSIEMSGSGPAFDVGGGLVFSALPLLDIGAFAGFTRVTVDSLEATTGGKPVMVTAKDSAKWVEFGAFVGLHF